MALVIETGAGVPGANSYVSVVDAQAIVTAIGFTTVVTEALLLRAMYVLGGLEWAGTRTYTSTQPLAFPRTGVYLSDNRALGINEIPDELIYSQALLAHYISTGTDPTAVSSPGVKSEAVDVIRVEYLESTVKSSKSIYDIPIVYDNLKHMLRNGGSSMRIERA